MSRRKTADPFEVVPPSDGNAELSVLGAIIIKPHLFDAAFDTGLTTEDFCNPAYRTYATAMVRLVESGEGIDPTTVEHEVAAMGAEALASLGGGENIGVIASLVHDPSNVGSYARIVRDHSRRRSLLALGKKLALSNGADLHEIIGSARDELAEIESRGLRQAAPLGPQASEVEKRNVRWLCPGYIPRGRVTDLEGNPNEGKSLFACDLAARISSGDVGPDGAPCDPGAVIMVSAEDDAGDTIRPRLEAAGARLDKITLIGFTMPDGEPLTLPQHLPLIEAEIRRANAHLVVIDPLSPYLSEATDSHRDQSVRRMLAELSAVAERTDAAILIIRHLNKRNDSGNPLFRSAGSVAFVAACRAAFLIASDPDDDTEDVNSRRRVLAPLKMNIARMPDSLSFRIVSTETGAPRLSWDTTPADRSARDLLREPDRDDSNADAIGDAMAFLATELGNGPRPSAEMFEAAAAHNICATTLKRARQKLGVKSRKSGIRGGWQMFLPGRNGDVPENLDPSKNGDSE